MNSEKFIKVKFDYLERMPFEEACFLSYLEGECRLHSGRTKVRQNEVCKLLNLTDFKYRKFMDELTEAGFIVATRCRNGKYISMGQDCRNSTIKIDDKQQSRLSNSNNHDCRIASIKIDDKQQSHTYKRINIEEEVRNARTRVKAPYSGDGILEAWTEHYRAAFGTDYIPDWSSNASDTVTLDKAVEKKMEQYHENYSDLEAKKDFCRRMFDAMLKVADPWQRDHWSLHTVTTQFNQLFNTIINGKANNNNGTRNASTDTEYIKRVMREAGLPVADPCGM